MTKLLLDAAERLRQIALGYPETYEEAPWGDRVVKVKGKIFFFCGVRDGELCLSAKLPDSNAAALALPFVEPTGYGLGKAGWVSVRLAKGVAAHQARFAAWIDESYRALAPKKLVASLGQTQTHTPTKKAAPKTKVLKKRALLVCHDPLRTERAVTGFAKMGLKLATTTDVNTVRSRLSKLDAVVIDLGRQQEEGLQLAAEIDDSDHAVAIFLAGLRDAAARRRAKDLSSADLFTAAPGDPEVIAAITRCLS